MDFKDFNLHAGSLSPSPSASESLHPRTPPAPAPAPAQTVSPAQSQASQLPSASTAPSHISPAVRIRRRNRMITSCLECRRRKLKCDKSHPCTNCTKNARDCVFLAPALDQASQLKLTEIKEKVGSLERLLERDVARSAAQAANSSLSDRALPDDADDDLPGAEDEKDLEATPLAVGDAVYDDDADAAGDELLDLGIQIGRMRITERIGGFFRPKISEELEYTLSDERGKKPTFPPSPPVSKLSNPSGYSRDFLKPGPGYIAPASSFFFGPPTHQTSLIDFLPSRQAADRLVKRYFLCVHSIAKMLHRPSFEKEYEAFWDDVSLGIEPPSSAQATVFSVMFSGVVSMDEQIIMRDFGVSKESLIDNFRLGTETALGRANFLRTTKVETLQAFVMYLIPLCRAEVSRAHSVLVGAAIRMAECMGLHRDGESYGLNPLETNIRRYIWYQLCFLDIRTCEAQGPRPTIRKDDFDTKLPVNIDDNDLHPHGKMPAAVDKWTDATFTLIRFELNEMMRTIWTDRPRIERRKISLTAVLTKIETFRRNMAAKYDHLMDERVPLHRCGRMTKNLLMSRLHVMTLHRYHNSVTNAMPERLRAIMLNSGTIMLENSVSLEIMPEVQQWAWYSGALHQYHVAFLLLIDVFYYPNRKEADRIWPCLDYVFKTDISQPREVKARAILTELQEKTAVYQEMRKMRAPSSMQKHVGQQAPRRVDMGGVGAIRQNIEAASASPTTVGRAPLPGVVFAGVSNGEALWALPNRESSEGTSDTGSVQMGAASPPPVPNTGNPDDLMAEIDWDVFDQLFPPGEMAAEMNTSPMNFGVY